MASAFFSLLGFEADAAVAASADERNQAVLIGCRGPSPKRAVASLVLLRRE